MSKKIDGDLFKRTCRTTRNLTRRCNYVVKKAKKKEALKVIVKKYIAIEG